MIKKHMLNDDKGVTLVELMIAMVLSLLLMSAAYMAFNAQHKSSLYQQEVSAMQQDIRAAMDIIARDIREAGLDPTHEVPNHPDRIEGIVVERTVSGFTTTVSDNRQIYLVKDLDGNGAINGSHEAVHIDYALTANSTITRSEVLTGSDQELARNVRRFNITYLDENNNVLAGATDDARVLDITIVVRGDRVDPETGQFIERTINKRIARRNYKE